MKVLHYVGSSLHCITLMLKTGNGSDVVVVVVVGELDAVAGEPEKEFNKSAVSCGVERIQPISVLLISRSKYRRSLDARLHY